MKNDTKRNIFCENRPFVAQATRVLLGKNRIAVDENLKGGPRALSRAPFPARLLPHAAGYLLCRKEASNLMQFSGVC